MNSRPLLFSLALPSLVTLAAAQGAGPGDHTPPIAAIDQAIAVEPEGDAVRVGGWNYEATIDAQGLRYVPALGARAPNLQHLTLCPIDYGRGALRQSACDGEPVAGVDAVACRRGPTATEHFAVTPAGLALSWRFAAPLAGDGDLVVRYRVATSLPTLQRGADGLAFLLPEIGGVGIGAVTGVDALGNRAAGELRLIDDVLELRLPDEFVDAASWPLVLDPLIGTQFLATTNATYDDSQPDVAYDVTAGVWLVVYRRVFSATNVAVRAQRIDGAGAMVGSYLGLATSGLVCANPKVADMNRRNMFAVVWQETASLFTDFDIVCRTVDAMTGALSVKIDVAASPAEEIDPDIAGDNTYTGDEALIVYTQTGSGAGIVLKRVTIPGSGLTPVLASGNQLLAYPTARYPAISKSNPGDGVYLVASTHDSSTLTYLDVCVCDRAGNRLVGPVVMATGSLSTGGLGRVDVDGDGSIFLITYEKFEAAGSALRDVWCRSLEWNGSSLVAHTSAMALADTVGTDQRQPAVAWCDGKFVLAYTDQPSATSNNMNIVVRELSDVCTWCGPTTVLSGLTPTSLRQVEHSPAIASRFSGGGVASDEALIVFAESDDQPPFTSSLIAQAYEAMAGQPPVNLGGGCGAGGIIGTGGPFAPGNLDFRITVSGIPSGAVPILMFGFPGPTSTCGPCSYINSITNVYVPPFFAGSSYNWRLPCSISPAVGMSFDVQWVLFASGASPCPLFATISLSDRMRLTLAY